MEVLAAVNRSVPQVKGKQKGASTYPVYRVDKALGIVPKAISDHLDLIVVREDCRDKRDALVRGKCMAGQSLPV